MTILIVCMIADTSQCVCMACFEALILAKSCQQVPAFRGLISVSDVLTFCRNAACLASTSGGPRLGAVSSSCAELIACRKEQRRLVLLLCLLHHYGTPASQELDPWRGSNKRHLQALLSHCHAQRPMQEKRSISSTALHTGSVRAGSLTCASLSRCSCALCSNTAPGSAQRLSACSCAAPSCSCESCAALNVLRSCCSGACDGCSAVLCWSISVCASRRSAAFADINSFISSLHHHLAMSV